MPLGPGTPGLGRARWGSRCRRPVLGGGPDLAAVGAGKDRPAVVCARPPVGRPADQRFKPLGGVSRLERAASLDHPNVADPLRCRRRERQLTGRSGTDVGVALDVAPWAPARRLPADDHDFRPIQVVAQHEMATGVDHPTHADPGGHASGTSVRSAPKVGHQHIAERPVSGISSDASAAALVQCRVGRSRLDGHPA